MRHWIKVALALTSKPVAMLAALVVFAGAVAIAEPARRAPPLPFGRLTVATGNVHGSIYAQFKTRKIYLTDFPVVLRNARTNTDSAPITTDRYGRYYFRNHVNGDYHLCWTAPGWTPGCAPNPIRIHGNISFLPTQRVSPSAGPPTIGPSGAAIWGQVALADGSSPWFFEPFFGVKQEVKVVVGRGATTIATLYTNTAGEFVVPYIAFSGGPVKLTATAGGGTATANATPGQGNPLALTIADKRPSIVGFSTLLNGQQRHEVPISATLNMKAEIHDADGDKPKVVWGVSPANGTVSPAGGTATTWNLPDRPGIMTLYALADDGKGGIAVNSTSVSAGADSADFTLSLIDAVTKARVTTATVTVNGTPAQLMPHGLYFARAPLSDRYVVNVSAPTYIFASNIYDHGGNHHQIRLEHASTPPTTATPRSIRS